MEFWNPGDRAYAYWEEDEYFYPASVIKVDGDEIYVRFDTGEEEWTTPDDMDDYDADPGEEVECKASDGLYYEATILNVNGERIEVEYEDGTTEWTNLNRLRFYLD